jgi:hypothetical protein
MLGVALTAQRAGWAGGPPKVTIFVTTTVSQSVYQTPSFSFAQGVSSGNRFFVSSDDSSYDITGYTSQAGFNNARYTSLSTFYLPWDTGMTTGTYATPFNAILKQAGNTSATNIATAAVASGNVVIAAGYNNSQSITLGNIAVYANRWMTVVSSGAETSSVFAGWTGTGTGTNYNRVAVYDTQTGQNLGLLDYVDSTARLAITGYANSVSANISSTTSVAVSSFGSATRNMSLAGQWHSFGTMFDPQTQTGREWLTLRIPQILGTGNAWYNPAWSNTYQGGNNYYLNNHTDLLVTAGVENKAGVLTTGGTTTFNAFQSTTNIPKDTS